MMRCGLERRISAGFSVSAVLLAAAILTFFLFSAQAQANGLAEPEAQALVIKFVDATADHAPSLGGADLVFETAGFTRQTNGVLMQPAGAAIVSSPPQGAEGPMVMTFMVQEWTGLLVDFEDAMARRFGLEAVTRIGDELPATYQIQFGGAELMMSFTPAEKDGAKVIALVAVGFQ